MSFSMSEFECPDCGRFESLVERPVPDQVDCPACGLTSPWVISAPLGRVRRGEVVQGKEIDRPADKYVMDTRPLADGMPLEEFKARRAKVHRDIAHERLKRALS